MKYSSKLLLFGEYTVINGSRALAVPYERYYGEWIQAAAPDERLLALANYLDEPKGHAFLQVDAFRMACREAWIFQSNIPLGYGLGSSGALCAAVYDRFAKSPIHRENTSELSILKQQLAWMESFFHGSSSGTDPLICYLNYPTVIHPKSGIRQVSVPGSNESTFQLFLLNTGLARSTGPLVDLYLEKCKDTGYSAKIAGELVPVVDQLIDDYLEGRWPAIYESMRTVSAFQWEYFSEMIPEVVRTIWKDGLTKKDYSLKLCGAGGGGFLLGITTSQNAIEQLKTNFTCHLLL